MKLALSDLRCEYLVNPLGIEELNPRLSWAIKSSGKGVVQTAYRIVVSTSPELLLKDEGDLWDSSKIGSAQSSQIEYDGKALSPFLSCFWKVMIWDNNSAVSTWSSPAKWSMGPVQQENWQGEWISYPIPSVKDSPLFRKKFSLAKKIKRAVLFTTAKGLYEVYLNGEKVGDDIFTPGWTDYNKRIYYNTYDVTNMLRKGSNAIGGVLGEGWYKGPIGFTGKMNCYGTDTRCLFNLRIEYHDGSVECVNTDKTWKTTLGPILQSTFLWGENYDARQELQGWSSPGFNDRKWQTVLTKGLTEKIWNDKLKKNVDKTDLLQPYPCETVQVTEQLKTIEFWEANPGSWIFDLGQNFAGRVKLRVKAKAGTMIRIRYAEMINPDKTLYVENLRSAYSTDTYICKGGGIEEWEPSFTFHGFRYAEVTGLPAKPRKNTIIGMVIGSNTSRVGHFSCDNPKLNQLYSNIVWTQRANFLDVPTDCPQRDERLGWTGDAQAYIRTAICNMDVAAFFKKWLLDLEDTQDQNGALANFAPAPFDIPRADAAWGDAITICPWTLYQCYGDINVLKKYYPAMKKWVAYLKSTSDDLIRNKTHCFGDWLSIGADTEPGVIQTAFFAYSTTLTAKVAKVLGKKSDTYKYEKLSTEIKNAFCEKYVKKTGRVESDTQTAYVLALHFDLVPDDLIPKIVKRLVEDIHKRDDHLSTGFVGAPYLMHVLTKHGHLELAYKLLLNKTYPSWLYSVENGATTIWERWNGWKKGEGCGDANMNSFSHYAYGAVGEWLFNTVAGIDFASSGFNEITIAPNPSDGLSSASAEYNSVHGKITSSWSVNNEVFSLDITIPANTTATVRLPVGNNAVITESGVSIKEVLEIDSISTEKSQTTLKVGSGNYKFTSKRSTLEG